MIGFDVQDVSISVFDLHTTVKPLQAPGASYLQAPFGLLLDRSGYNAAYGLARGVANGGLLFRPLAKGVLNTHFWQSYLIIDQQGQGDHWRLQVPFVCRQRFADLALNVQVPGCQVSGGWEIYLSSIGWSTHLLVRVRGAAKDADLIELVRRLMGQPQADGSKPPEDLPLMIQGQPKSLTDAFIYFQKLLLGAVYRANNPPHGEMKIPRHCVISLNALRAPGSQPALRSYEHLKPGEKADLLSLLYGKRLGATDVVQREQRGDQLLLTRISGPNFALTSFDKGTLLCAQREAFSAARAAAPHCLAANMRYTVMMAYALQNYYDQAAGSAAGSAAAELRACAKKTLQQLRQAYSNQFCQTLLTHHKDLARIIAEP